MSEDEGRGLWWTGEFRGRTIRNDAMKEIGQEIRAENEEGKELSKVI